MATITAFGNQSKTTILVSESHKLTQEFTVDAGQTIYPGQPVKLGTDGTITPWAKTDTEADLIGTAYNKGTAGGLVTVVCRGFQVQWGLSAAVQNAGPVTFNAYDNATDAGGSRIGYNKYEAKSTNAMLGWALDAATGANQLIRVLVKN